MEVRSQDPQFEADRSAHRQIDQRDVALGRAGSRDVTGRVPELSCTGGTSDGRFIADICPEVVELGPVNATIHKLNERVLVSDLEPLSKIYRGILQRLLG